MDKQRKQLNKKINRFYKSLRTHLSKDIIYSKSFNRGGKLNFGYAYESEIHKSILLLVISNRSKMELDNPNKIIQRIMSLRTYKDLNIGVKKSSKGINIIIEVEGITYSHDILIFKEYRFADQILCSYQTDNGYEYFWHDIIDYEIHPQLVLDKYADAYHKELMSLLINMTDLRSKIDWTHLIVKRMELSESI